MLGSTGGLIPSKNKGRGLYKSDRAFEFQIASIFKDEENAFDGYKNYCKQLANSWQGTQAQAKRTPILPEKVDAKFLTEEIKLSTDRLFPIGINKHSLGLNTPKFKGKDQKIEIPREGCIVSQFHFCLAN